MNTLGLTHLEEISVLSGYFGEFTFYLLACSITYGAIMYVRASEHHSFTYLQYVLHHGGSGVYPGNTGPKARQVHTIDLGSSTNGNISADHTKNGVARWCSG